jgi:uncharacterized protein (TIGR03067 family)
MNRKICVLLVAAFLLAGTNYLATVDAKDKKPGDKKKLQGAWTMTKDNETIRMTFDGEKFKLEFKGKSADGTFTIDPTKTPKTMDVAVTKGSDAETMKYEGKTAKAIYEFDGDKLKWLANEPGKEDRPAAFPKDGEKAKGLYLVLEREKK